MSEHGDAPNAGGVVMAFLAGAVAGVAIGLLLAPRPGKESRAQLADLAERAARAAADAAQRFKSAAGA
jgi:gas vesicle protein